MKPEQFFNVRGRISRGQFWLQSLFFWIVLYLLSSVFGPSAAGMVVWCLNGIVLVVLTMLCIRRLHDRNYSGWWLMVVLVPVVGALWLSWQLALRRGVAQDNRWGPDPLQPRGDYLVVS
ncbi:MAG: DUF805 domain-containing protein [Ramlibacter sp.]